MKDDQVYSRVFASCLELLHKEADARRIADFLREKPDDTSVQADDLYPVIVGALIECYREKILRFALAYVDSDHAEDVVQIVSLKIFTHLRTFKGNNQSSFLTWVCTITHNVARGLHRGNKPVDQFDEEIADHTVNLSSEVSAKQVFNNILIEQIFSGIAPADRILLTMFYQDGLTSEEVAQILGCEPVSVRVRMTRLTGLIQQRFLKQEESKHKPSTRKSSKSKGKMTAREFARLHSQETNST